VLREWDEWINHRGHRGLNIEFAEEEDVRDELDSKPAPLND
jgi:hypothetical protein